MSSSAYVIGVTAKRPLGFRLR